MPVVRTLRVTVPSTRSLSVPPTPLRAGEPRLTPLNALVSLWM